MKNIFAACIALFGLSAQAQVLEKPQLVEKIDTTIVVEEVIAEVSWRSRLSWFVR